MNKPKPEQVLEAEIHSGNYSAIRGIIETHEDYFARLDYFGDFKNYMKVSKVYQNLLEISHSREADNLITVVNSLGKYS
jgi:hypothetical protein